MDKFSRGVLIVIAVVLSTMLALQIMDRIERQTRAQALTEARAKIFEGLLKEMASAETKSVWHQIYHVASAQLQMQALMTEPPTSTR